MSNIIITKSDIKKFVNLFRAGLKSKGYKEMDITTGRIDESSYDHKEESDKDTRYWIRLSFNFSISKDIADKIKNLDAKPNEIDDELEPLKTHE